MQVDSNGQVDLRLSKVIVKRVLRSIAPRTPCSRDPAGASARRRSEIVGRLQYPPGSTQWCRQRGAVQFGVARPAPRLDPPQCKCADAPKVGCRSRTMDPTLERVNLATSDMVRRATLIDADRDIYATQRCANKGLLQPQPRAASPPLSKQGGRDFLQKPHSRQAMHTFWDRRRNRGPRGARVRIVPRLLRQSLKPTRPDSGVDCAVGGRQASSDPAPAWVEFS